jgi:glycosyltransferase involved in cell wall biosynthesis
MTGLPIISTCHGFIANDRNLKLYNMLDRIVLRSFDNIISVSEEIKNGLIKSGINGSHVRVIKNAVEVNSNNGLSMRNRRDKRQLLNVQGSETVVAYIGRLSQEKGVRYLVQAIVLLSDSYVPVKLLIFGEGPEKKALKDLVKEKSVGGKVIFVGFQGDIENWLPAVDVFVLPSLTEGTPMALLEAMASGIPVVASAVGGVPQVIVSGKNGILVAPGKPEEIADALNTLSKNEGLRKRLAEEAKRTIRLKYNVDEWVKKVEAEYLRTIHKAGK